MVFNTVSMFPGAISNIFRCPDLFSKFKYWILTISYYLQAILAWLPRVTTLVQYLVTVISQKTNPTKHDNITKYFLPISKCFLSISSCGQVIPQSCNACFLSLGQWLIAWHYLELVAWPAGQCSQCNLFTDIIFSN